MTVRRTMTAATLGVFAALACSDALATATPDQVLVLYNKDWTEDLDGSAPGQDSEEVARYYVARHTDPTTGKKPVLLGLSCAHGKKHLDEFRMQEDKGDNERGVVFKGKGTLPDAFLIPSAVAAWSPAGGDVVPARQGDAVASPADRDTVVLRYSDATRKEVDPKRVVIRVGPSDELETNPVVYAGGKCLKDDWVDEQNGRWIVKVAAFNGGKSKLWFKGANDKGEVVIVLAAVFAWSPNAAGPPQGVFRFFVGACPRIGVTKEECESPDPASMRVTLGTEDDPAKAKIVWPAPADAKAGEEPLAMPAAGLRDFLLRPAAFAKGTVYAWLTGRGADGKEFTKRGVWFDPREFEGSLTGPDGIPDDKFYQEDIAGPVKKFLEDPANRTADGTLLKDRILYVVACYGLPLQVKSAYGIRRGTLSGSPGDAGTGAALESRLAMLYYDDRAFAKPVVLPQGSTQGPLATISTNFRATLSGGTIQGGVHPYRHPWAQQDVRGRPDVIPKELEHPHFTADLRRTMGDRFLYLASRVDGHHPEIAKAQIDGAVYATRFLTTKLKGAIKWGEYREGKRGAKELEALGFDMTPATWDDPRRTLFVFGQFGYGNRNLEEEFQPKKGARQVTYGEKPMLPGGVGYVVRSGEGWRGRVHGQFGSYQDKALEAGASVAGGDALGAHITSHSWWDDQVFFHHLFRGWDAAESLYMSTIYLGWVTYYVLDPLYAPDLSKTTPDAAPPTLASGTAFAVKFGEGKTGAWARVLCELAQTPGAPEMAEIRVECWPTGEPAKKVVGANWRYLARPVAYVGGLEPGRAYQYRVVLTDPYGNVFDSDRAMSGRCVFTAPACPKARRVGEATFAGDEGAFALKANSLLDKADLERGEIHLTYVVEQEGGSARWVLRGSMAFYANTPKAGAFEAGGAPVQWNTVIRNREKPEAWTFEPWAPKKGEETRVVLRWSREPLMREMALVARDGTEFLLGANNYIPWRPASAEATPPGALKRAPSGIRVETPEKSGVRILRVALYDRTDPPPVEHSAVYPHMLDGDAFDKANAK